MYPTDICPGASHFALDVVLGCGCCDSRRHHSRDIPTATSQAIPNTTLPLSMTIPPYPVNTTLGSLGKTVGNSAVDDFQPLSLR